MMQKQNITPQNCYFHEIIVILLMCIFKHRPLKNLVSTKDQKNVPTKLMLSFPFSLSDSLSCK